MFRRSASLAIPHRRSFTAIPSVSLVLLGHTNRSISVSHESQHEIVLVWALSRPAPYCQQGEVDKKKKNGPLFRKVCVVGPLLGVGGVRGGGGKFLPRGASKYAPPLPSPAKCHLARNWWSGGGVYNISLELTCRMPLASHDSNPYPNHSRIARYNATKIFGGFVQMMGRRHRCHKRPLQSLAIDSS